MEIEKQRLRDACTAVLYGWVTRDGAKVKLTSMEECMFYAGVLAVYVENELPPL